MRRGRQASSRSFLEWLPLILVLGTALFVFAPVRDAQFLQWDDFKTIAANPDLNPPTASGVLRYWDPRRPYMDLYVPVTYTAWAAVASFAGSAAPSPPSGAPPRLDPAAFHTASLAVHLLAIAMAFLILRDVLDERRRSDIAAKDDAAANRTRRAGFDGMAPAVRAAGPTSRIRSAAVPWAAGIGAGLFALHPLQVETVAWASGLKDLLAGALTLTALWLYLRFVIGLRATGRGLPTGRRRPDASYGLTLTLATMAFVLAMLAKPSAVVAPLLAACLVMALPWSRKPDSDADASGPLSPPRGWLALRRAGTSAPASAAAADVLPALAPLALWLFFALPITFIARRVQPAPTAALGFDTPFWTRPLVALDALAFYAAKLVAPIRLAMDYSRSPDWLAATPWIWWTWTIPVAIGAIVLLARRRAPWLPAVALFPVAALLPVLGLVRFDFQSHSTVADHYVYVALVGPALALALFLARRGSTGEIAACALLLVPLAVLSRFQVPVWHDSTALFTHTLDVNPRSVAANINLGHTYYAQGRTEEAMRFIEAALATRPGEPEAHNNMGNALLRLKRPREAAEHYRVALAASPSSPRAHFNLGLALAAGGDPEAAALEYDEALHLDPNDAVALANRAELYLNARDYDKAVDLYRRALAADPALTPARRGLANALAGQAGAGGLAHPPTD